MDQTSAIVATLIIVAFLAWRWSAPAKEKLDELTAERVRESIENIDERYRKWCDEAQGTPLAVLATMSKVVPWLGAAAKAARDRESSRPDKGPGEAGDADGRREERRRRREGRRRERQRAEPDNTRADDAGSAGGPDEAEPNGGSSAGSGGGSGGQAGRQPDPSNGPSHDGTHPGAEEPVQQPPELPSGTGRTTGPAVEPPLGGRTQDTIPAINGGAAMSSLISRPIQGIAGATGLSGMLAAWRRLVALARTDTASSESLTRTASAYLAQSERMCEQRRQTHRALEALEDACYSQELEPRALVFVQAAMDANLAALRKQTTAHQQFAVAVTAQAQALAAQRVAENAVAAAHQYLRKAHGPVAEVEAVTGARSSRDFNVT
jgi:hypothetical protein